jgi:hypothetical protein
MGGSSFGDLGSAARGMRSSQHMKLIAARSPTRELRPGFSRSLFARRPTAGRGNGGGRCSPNSHISAILAARTAPGLLLGPLTIIIRSPCRRFAAAEEEYSRLPLAQDAERNARMRLECRRRGQHSRRCAKAANMSAERVAAASVARGMMRPAAWICDIGTTTPGGKVMF